MNNPPTAAKTQLTHTPSATLAAASATTATLTDAVADRCLALDGQCKHPADDEHEHESAMVRVPAIPGGDDQPPMDSYLASFWDSDIDGWTTPKLSIGWGWESAELTPDQADKVAVDLEAFAVQLRAQAAHLRAALRQYTATEVQA